MEDVALDFTAWGAPVADDFTVLKGDGAKIAAVVESAMADGMALKDTSLQALLDSQCIFAGTQTL